MESNLDGSGSKQKREKPFSRAWSFVGGNNGIWRLHWPNGTFFFFWIQEGGGYIIFTNTIIDRTCTNR